MDEERIENALRAGPVDEQMHRQGSLGRALAERESVANAGTFRVRLRSQPSMLSGIAVVALVLLLAAGLFVYGRLNQVAGPPSPSPSPSAPAVTPSVTPSQSAVGAPVELVDRWLGPVREIAGLQSPATRAFLEIDGASLSFDAGAGQPRDLLASAVRQDGPNVLRLTATTPSTACSPFQVGTYRWSLSPGKVNLTLAVIRDDCPARAATLPGTWTHTACRNQPVDCLGQLEAGTYSSSEFDPFASGRAGQMTYTVPDGWSDSADGPTNYSLRPTADYLADPGFDGGDTVSGIYVFGGTVAADQPDDCSAVPAPGVPVTAAGIADYLAARSGLHVVDSGTVHIGEREARELDITIDPAFTQSCPWSNGQPFRAMIMFADLGLSGGVWGADRCCREHVFLVDVAPGRVVSVWVDGPVSGFDDLLAKASPIIGTIHFQNSSGAP